MTKTYIISIYDATTDELKREVEYEGTFKNMGIKAENITEYDEYWMWSEK